MGSMQNVPAHWKVKFWRGVASWVVFMPDRGEGPADVSRPSFSHYPASPGLTPHSFYVLHLPQGGGRVGRTELEVLFLLQMGQQRLLMFNDVATPC